MLKKSTCAGIAIALIGSGIGLSIIGMTLGAHMGVSFTSEGIELGGTIAEVISSEVNYGSSIGAKQIVKHEVLPNFEKMDLKIGMAEVDVIVGNDYSIDIEINEKFPIKYEVRENTLYVEQESYKNVGINIGNTFEGEDRVTITVPQNVALGDSKIETGVGDWNISGINFEDLDLSIGLGRIEISNVKAMDIDIEGGIGDISMDNVSAKDITASGGMGLIYGTNLKTTKLDVEAGMGDVDLTGTFDGDIRINGGVGTFKLNTTLARNAYNYRIDGGIGLIYINEEKVNALDTYTQNNGSNRELKIECGMGNVEINTKE